MIDKSTNAIQCYTSYFGVLSKLPEDAVPISITLYKPSWFSGRHLASLRPPVLVHDAYRINQISQNEYRRMFCEQVLMRLDPHRIMSRLQNMAGPNKIPALVCYEKSSDFCHRHMIAEWLNTYNIGCIEWRPEGAL